MVKGVANVTNKDKQNKYYEVYNILVSSKSAPLNGTINKERCLVEGDCYRRRKAKQSASTPCTLGIIVCSVYYNVRAGELFYGSRFCLPS